MNGWVYLCSMRKLSMDELGRKSVDEFKKADKTPIIVVLDNIRSMHNVGSVFRSADAFLVEAIFLCGYTPQPPHRDIHKTALGATETVDWMYFPTTKEAVELLLEKDYHPYAVEQAAESVTLDTFHAPQSNEVEGVDADIIPLCKGCIEIPQWGMKHSLNISVAAGIVLWELVKQQQPLT